MRYIETQEKARKHIFNVMKGKKDQHRILYPAKILSNNKGEIKPFWHTKVERIWHQKTTLKDALRQMKNDPRYKSGNVRRNEKQQKW